MNRTYLLPVVTTIAALGSACSPSVEGEWDLTAIVEDGYSYDYPYVSTDTYDDIIYTYTAAFGMVFDDQETVTLRQTLTYAETGEPDEVDTYTYAGTWSKVERKTFAIDFPELDLAMNCTVDGDDLECDVADDDMQLLFTRAE